VAVHEKATKRRSPVIARELALLTLWLDEPSAARLRSVVCLIACPAQIPETCRLGPDSRGSSRVIQRRCSGHLRSWPLPRNLDWRASRRSLRSLEPLFQPCGREDKCSKSLEPDSCDLKFGESANWMRDECLNANWLRNLMDTRAKTGAWRDEYNGKRPGSSLSYRTPNEFAAILKSSVMTG